MRTSLAVALYALLLSDVTARSARLQQRREERSAEACAAIGAGGLGFAASAQMGTSYMPGSMARYKLRRPLPVNLRVGVALAAAAAGVSATRACWSTNEPAQALRSIGRLPLSAIDSFDAKRARGAKRRRDKERQDWLKANTKRSTIYRPDQ